MGKAEALKVLERMLPKTADDAERAALRADPEKYKAYLKSLDEAYGERAKRAKDLGFSDKNYYHGSTSDIPAFDPEKQRHYVSGKGTYVTSDPNTASDYANIRMNYKESSPHIQDFKDGKISKEKLEERLDERGRVYPLKVREGVNYDFSNDVANLKNENPDVMSQILKDSGFDSTTAYGDSRTKAIFKPENIRSTNAAFDPRFKDSADILSLAGNQAPKIVARMLKPQMNLGSAFSAIAEPIQKIDAPVNNLIEQGADKFSKLTDLKRGTGAGDDEDYQPIAKQAFNQFVGAVTPTPSSILAGKAMPLLSMAGKGAGIAEKMVQPVEKDMATLYREAKGKISGSQYGTVVVKPDPVPNFGTVTVKP